MRLLGRAAESTAAVVRLSSGRYVTVLLHTHQQVNSPAEACRLTVSGPGSRARSFVHVGTTGDFEMTFAARRVSPGAWRSTESCQALRGARSRVASVIVRVVGGHGRGALGGRVGPFFNAQEPPLSAGNGGAGTPLNPFQPRRER